MNLCACWKRLPFLAAYIWLWLGGVTTWAHSYTTWKIEIWPNNYEERKRGVCKVMSAISLSIHSPMVNFYVHESRND